MDTRTFSYPKSIRRGLIVSMVFFGSATVFALLVPVLEPEDGSLRPAVMSKAAESRR